MFQRHTPLKYQELVLFENGEIKRLASIPIGALNLQNKAVKGIAATDREIKKMKKIILVK